MSLSHDPFSFNELTEPAGSIREEYERHGADAYYQQYGSTYRNPHEDSIIRCLRLAAERWPLDLSRVLDLAAGSGEVTLALRDLGAKAVDAIDPYTAQAYGQRTGQVAEPFTFADVAAGALDGRRYGLIACSFALHLCEPSRLPGLMYRLSLVADSLLVLTPHKRPHIAREWGWELEGEFVVERVRARFHRAG
ncbi:MAG TPA: class I SAM-dependent methyltransferase [Tepidisphaeraceae bacterium]|jgi:SAM-dependent methyltransferase|nr:class I SAM-dependent methyltransferase [Tepidisphaeraceae bacterium]